MDRPLISLNFAISADGKITGRTAGDGRWTSDQDLDRLLRLRVGCDALLVGRGTLDTDAMTLTIPARLDPAARPLRCVVSRTGAFDPAHRLFHTPGGPVHLLVTGAAAPSAVPAGATLHHGPLGWFLERLHDEFGVRRLHCEGGGELARALFDLDAVDTLHLTWAAHTLFGGHDHPTITGLPGDFLPASRNFNLEAVEPRPDLGEWFLTYRRALSAH